MATKKKLLQAAAGSAGGAGPLNVEDVFSSYLYDGNSEGLALENGINLGQSNDGTSVIMNLYTSTDSLTSSDDTDSLFINNNNIIDFGTGDFTFECWVWTKDYGASTYNDIAGGDSSEFGLGIYGGTLYYSKNGVVNPLSVDVTTKLNQWMHIAVSRSSGTSKLFINGVEESSASDTNSFASANGVHIGRLGTRIYRHQGYISNVRIVKGTGIYTSAFTPPTSELTAVSGTALLLCNGDNPLEDASSNSHSITKQGNPKTSTFGPFEAATSGEGGLVWIKNRGPDTISQHSLFDTERGNGARLVTNSSNAQSVNQGYYNTAFNSRGFSIASNADTGTNKAGSEYASWTFRKAPKFFDVVTYTGNGTGTRQLSHNLDSTIGTIIVKRTDGIGDWWVYHRSARSTNADGYLRLNLTNAETGSNQIFPVSTYNSTQFTVGNSINVSSETYVAYLFAHNDGDGDFGSTADQDIIKCGSYTGNGSATGPSINLGFEPQWLLIKGTSSSDSWAIFDVMRGMTVGASDSYLFPNSSGAELSYSSIVKPTPTGFQLESVNWNTNGNNYIYIAIRRGPMAVPTDATDVFDASLRTGTGSVPVSISTNFAPDMWLLPRRNSSSFGNYLETRITGFDEWLETNSTAGPALTWTSGTGPSMNNDNIEITVQDNSVNQSGGTYVDYVWKRAPNYFDVVAYTGDGVAGRTVSHNLGVVPEMMWVKCRENSNRWFIYHKDLISASYQLEFDSGAQSTIGNPWNGTHPTSDVFTVNSNFNTNHNALEHIAYLFASLDGVSKVGSYTGNGTSQNIDCGFSSGARFVLIKRTDASGDWGLVDTERGIVAGNDNILYLNLTDAELTGFDVVDPYSSGFTVTSSFNNWNVNGGSYIFYAIA